MHKLLNKYKDLLIILACILFDVAIYWLTKFCLRTPNLIGNSIDKATPFLPGFVWIYILWYLMLIFVPLYISMRNKNSFIKYVTVFIISVTISGIIFVIYPTTVARPLVENNNFTNKILNLIYLADTPAVNCLPSIHCLFSYLFIFSILDCKEKAPSYMKIIISIASILVVLSTLFIKQHVIYDAIVSFVIIFATWIICDKLKIHEFVKTKIYDKFILEK